MKRSSPNRNGLALMVVSTAFASQMQAQSPTHIPVKPSPAISSLPVAQPTNQTGKVEGAPSAPMHHVEVNYTDGKLAVQATNASLNEVLREVAHQTSMKITGGIADDRVFGSYGPAAPSVVLDALLEGTGSNILLIDDHKGGFELILTPRHGGVTPPNPNAAQTNDSDDSNDVPSQYVPPVRPFQVPFANGRGSVGAPPDSPVLAPGSDPNDGAGAKTPQQIYEQLQKTMQQHQATNPLQQANPLQQ